jgi:uncharacterized protein YijF (DUF1287 family)
MMEMDRRALFVGAAALFIARPLAAQSAPGAAKLLAAARKQIGVTLAYDPAYTRLTFPGGDVPRNKGVCTDVVIRAYRDAFDVDLQVLVNADMRRSFSAYPKRWGLRTTDRNIDHRRVPNLEAFFTRAGSRRQIPLAVEKWQAGDLFTCLVNRSLPHIGIVSDKRTALGRPLVIHNIGGGTREEDILADYPMTGRFRWLING